MQPSNSSFIDDLSPREKRYDLEIDPNLFISVLPNGAKTWVLCDMVLGKPRRKTLGVYPEMTLSEARDAVERIASVGEHPNPLAVPQPKATASSPPLSPASSPLSGPSTGPADIPHKTPLSPPAHTVRDGRIVPAKHSRWPLVAAAVAGIMVLVAAAVFWFQGANNAVIVQSEAPPSASGSAGSMTPTTANELASAEPDAPAPPAATTGADGSEPVAPLAEAVEETTEVANSDPAPLPANEQDSSATLPEVADATAGEPAAGPVPMAPVDETSSADTTPEAAAPADAAPRETAEAQTSPTPTGSESTGLPPTDAPASVDIPEPVPVAEAGATPPPEDVAEAVPEAAEVAADNTAPANTAPAPAAPATAEEDASQANAAAPPANADATPSEDSLAMVEGASPEIPTDPAPTRGVARYQLTSAIRAREPTDDLGQSVSGGGADITRVYFFTDLRGLNGETVTHRWLYNGAPSASVDFDVGGWRWRTFSSKDLLLGQGGEWRIEVIDEAGDTLATHTFSFTP